MFTFNISIFIFTVLIILTAVYYKIYRIAVVVVAIYILFTTILFFLSKTETKTGQIVENIEYVKSNVTLEVVDTTVSIAETTVDLLQSNVGDTPAVQIVEEEITIEDSVQPNVVETPSAQIVEENITDNLEIRSIKVCRGIMVEQRKPIDVDTVFTMNEVGTLFCFTGIRNTNSDIQTITHIWEHNGRVKARIAMEVLSSPFWRCWSRKRITENQKGNWIVKIVNDAGTILGEKSFSVK